MMANYDIDSLYAVSFFTMFSIDSSRLLAYFRNSFRWSSLQSTFPLPTSGRPSSCTATITLSGYELSRHLVSMVADGKTLRTQETAVSRSCAPPSQLRDYNDEQNERVRNDDDEMRARMTMLSSRKPADVLT